MTLSPNSSELFLTVRVREGNPVASVCIRRTGGGVVMGELIDMARRSATTGYELLEQAREVARKWAYNYGFALAGAWESGEIYDSVVPLVLREGGPKVVIDTGRVI